MPPLLAYLGIGSNLGDRLAHLQGAVDGLAARAGPVVAISAVYETDPVGGPQQGEFLNAVVAVETALSARELLVVAKDLEAEAGRQPGGPRNGPRALDVDVLLAGDERVDDADLVVPHPRMDERGFVQAPLGDVAPHLGATPPAGWPGVRRTALYLKRSE